MAKNGILPVGGDMWGPGGTAQLDSLELPDAYFNRIAVLRDLVDTYDREIGCLDRDIHRILRDDAGYNAVQAIYGVGRVFAAVFVAEIGDVDRFDSPKALCSWAGLTPMHRESDTKVHRGGSPSKDHGWCAGPPSRRWPATTAVTHLGRQVPRDRRAARQAPKPTWPSPAKFSPSSTTACATARSAVSPTKRRRDARTRPGASSTNGKAPTFGVATPAK